MPKIAQLFNSKYLLKKSSLNYFYVFILVSDSGLGWEFLEASNLLNAAIVF